MAPPIELGDEVLGRRQETIPRDAEIPAQRSRRIATETLLGSRSRPRSFAANAENGLLDPAPREPEDPSPSMLQAPS